MRIKASRHQSMNGCKNWEGVNTILENDERTDKLPGRPVAEAMAAQEHCWVNMEWISRNELSLHYLWFAVKNLITE